LVLPSGDRMAEASATDDLPPPRRQ
jgi:hypothetical protein